MGFADWCLIGLFVTGIGGLLWASIETDRKDIESDAPGTDDFNMWW